MMRIASVVVATLVTGTASLCYGVLERGSLKRGKVVMKRVKILVHFSKKGSVRE